MGERGRKIKERDSQTNKERRRERETDKEKRYRDLQTDR
jgi:hypothetical protein